jgi:hypothetical protein
MAEEAANSTDGPSSDDDALMDIVADKIRKRIRDERVLAQQNKQAFSKDRKKRPGPDLPVVRGRIEDSTWAVWMRNNHEGLQIATSAASILFRERFRVTYDIYRRTVELAEGWFPQKDVDAAGRDACPIYLKVLGVFRVLGRAYAFDGIAELCNTDAEIHRVFFHQFVVQFATELQDEWIRMPHGDELVRIMRMYAQRGLPGAVGSMDGWQMFLVTARALRRAAKGKEGGFPNRGYNMIASPQRRVLSLNGGHLGNVNDKSKVLYHGDVMDLESMYRDVFFDMYTSIDSDLRERFRHPYLICDAGYHRWRRTQCGLSCPTTAAENAYNEMFESIRKDVECTIGILKIRFRMLKNLFLNFKSMETVDAMVFYVLLAPARTQSLCS